MTPNERRLTKAVIVIDADGRVVFWDPEAEQLFGWSSAEMVGKTLKRIMPRHHWLAHQAALARLRMGDAPRLMGRMFHLEALDRAGKEFPVELALQKLSNDGAEPKDRRYIGVVRPRSEEVW